MHAHPNGLSNAPFNHSYGSFNGAYCHSVAAVRFVQRTKEAKLVPHYFSFLEYFREYHYFKAVGKFTKKLLSNFVVAHLTDK